MGYDGGTRGFGVARVERVEDRLVLATVGLQPLGETLDLAQADLGDARLSELSAQLGCLDMQIIARRRAEDATDLHARICSAISRGGAVVPYCLRRFIRIA